MQAFALYLIGAFVLSFISVWLAAKIVKAPNDGALASAKLAAVAVALDAIFFLALIYYFSRVIGRLPPMDLGLLFIGFTLFLLLFWISSISKILGTGLIQTIGVLVILWGIGVLTKWVLPRPIKEDDIATFVQKIRDREFETVVPEIDETANPVVAAYPVAATHAVLTAETVIQTRYGKMTLPRGTSLPIVSSTLDVIEVRTPNGGATKLPVSSVQLR